MQLCSNYEFEREESEELFEWLVEIAKKDTPVDQIDSELQTLIN